MLRALSGYKLDGDQGDAGRRDTRRPVRLVDPLPRRRFGQVLHRPEAQRPRRDRSIPTLTRNHTPAELRPAGKIGMRQP
jgi:hypothetical protein